MRLCVFYVLRARLYCCFRPLIFDLWFLSQWSTLPTQSTWEKINMKVSLLSLDHTQTAFFTHDALCITLILCCLSDYCITLLKYYL